MSGSLGRRLRVAAAAAAAATLGDLALLYVVNAARPELALPPAPPLTLMIGGILGVLGIPLYWFGYSCLAEPLDAHRRRSAATLRGCGAVIGAVGAVIHALTALLIGLSDTATAGPLDALAGGGFAVVSLWAIAAVATLVAAVVVCAAAFAADASLPGVVALANPVTAILVLAAIGSACELGRAFLIPAAPNLAHLIFFTVASLSVPASD